MRLRVWERVYLHDQTRKWTSWNQEVNFLNETEWNRMKRNSTDVSIFWTCSGTLCRWAADNAIKHEKIKITTKKMTGSKKLRSLLFVNLVFGKLWICFNNSHNTFGYLHCDTSTVCALETTMGCVGSGCQVNKADLFRQTVSTGRLCQHGTQHHRRAERSSIL